MAQDISKTDELAVCGGVSNIGNYWSDDRADAFRNAGYGYFRANGRQYLLASGGRRRGYLQGTYIMGAQCQYLPRSEMGRGHETFGEDPYLTGRLGVRYIMGLQGHDEKYLKTAACAKHFAVHSGPEDVRHSFDARVSEQDLRETYLPAFREIKTFGFFHEFRLLRNLIHLYNVFYYQSQHAISYVFW